MKINSRWSLFLGSEEIAHLLIKNGANSSLKDDFGKTALHLAAENGNLTIEWWWKKPNLEIIHNSLI